MPAKIISLCGNCGKVVNTDSNYCPHCGSMISNTESTNYKKTKGRINISKMTFFDGLRLIYAAISTWAFIVNAELLTADFKIWLILFLNFCLAVESFRKIDWKKMKEN